MYKDSLIYLHLLFLKMIQHKKRDKKNAIKQIPIILSMSLSFLLFCHVFRFKDLLARVEHFEVKLCN